MLAFFPPDFVKIEPQIIVGIIQIITHTEINRGVFQKETKKKK